MKNNHDDQVVIKPVNHGDIDLTEVITTFIEEVNPDTCKNIHCLDNISSDFLANHNKEYLNLEHDENPMIMLNHKALFGIFTGLLITNKCIHFCTLKNKFFTGLLPWLYKGAKGKAFIHKLDSLEIAELDTSYGHTYVGHQLKINDEILGLIRMGRGMFPDNDAVAILNGLFDFLAEVGAIKQKTRAYAWQ